MANVKYYGVSVRDKCISEENQNQKRPLFCTVMDLIGKELKPYWEGLEIK